MLRELLALAERAVVALERIADAAEPAPRSAPKPSPEVSETDRAAARKLARKMGLVVREK